LLPTTGGLDENQEEDQSGHKGVYPDPTEGKLPGQCLIMVMISSVNHFYSKWND
jgi:hypothetical protein